VKVSILLITEYTAGLLQWLAVSESLHIWCNAIGSIISLPLSCPLQFVSTELQVARLMPLGFILHELIHIDIFSKTEWHWELIQFPKLTDIFQE
jgi:hypothetical protein